MSVEIPFSVHRRFISILAIILSITFAAAVAAFCDDVKQEMTTAVAAVRPALIRIHVVSTDYSQGRETKSESAGSGVIISPDGFAITNHHVAGDAERMVCTLADKREVEAKLIGTDPLADIAIIKLASPDGKPFPTSSFGDSSKIEVGDRVFAMGCPYALSQSVTMGIVSNVEMIMPENMAPEGFTLEGEDVGSIVRWIGHDALIEPGNSGGPLINRSGEIVGINEISFGLSGAIPSNLAKEVADQLIKNGKVIRSWLGLEIQPLLTSCTSNTGILVSGLMPNSPAQSAGFKPGDILLNLDGKEVTAKFKEQIPVFNQYVADLPIGKQVPVKVLRDGKEVTLTVTTTERSKAIDKQHELKSWGMCASNITYLMQKEMQLDSQDGVIVTGVLPSGPAGSAKPALQEEDIIVKIADEPVKDITQLRQITKKLTDGHAEPVPVIVNFDRKQKHYATVIKIGKKEDSQPGTEIEKAWLPIDMQVLTSDLAEALGVAGKTGVRVTQVYPGKSAEKAGIKVGDLIVKLDGEDIAAEQEGDEEVLPSLIRQYDIGAEVKLGIIRNGKPVDVNVKLETSPKPTRDYPKYEDQYFDFVARDIAFSDKSNGNVDQGQTGVYVDSVSEGSWASLGNMRTGDVVTKINNVDIKNLNDLKTTMTDIESNKLGCVVVVAKRGIHTVYLELKPEWPES